MIYVIRNESHLKVGYSKDPDKRVKQLQTGAAHALILVGIMPGGVRFEKSIHRHLMNFRANGEWFFAHEYVVEYLYTLIKTHDHSFSHQSALEKFPESVFLDSYGFPINEKVVRKLEGRAKVISSVKHKAIEFARERKFLLNTLFNDESLTPRSIERILKQKHGLTTGAAKRVMSAHKARMNDVGASK